MATPSVRGTVKSWYAAAAHGVGAALTAIHVLGAEPPPRERRTRHWIYSLTRVHDSVAMVDLDVPWWTYRAVDEVERWLGARPRPARVFEYGSGASTVWLARRAASVVSVEHHEEFAALMRELLAPIDNATLLVRPATASAVPDVPSAKEGYAGLDFAAYVGAIDGTEGDFDLVVVDGRARERCLERALRRLAPDGLVVFDNSRRRRYRRAIEAAPVLEHRLAGLTPTLPYPDQTSLLRHA
jgi:SAM-dependent methyltransferase